MQLSSFFFPSRVIFDCYVYPLELWVGSRVLGSWVLCEDLYSRGQTTKNLGVILETDLSFSSHVKAVTKSAYYHLKNIASIKSFVSSQNLEKLVHAFITSTEYKPNRPLRSVGSSQLEIPRVHTKQGESAFSYFASRSWNQLPEEIRCAKTLATFKSRLKTHLFSCAFVEWALCYVQTDYTIYNHFLFLF